MERTRANHPTATGETLIVQEPETPVKEATPLQEIPTNLVHNQELPQEETQDHPLEEVVIRPYKSIPSSRLRKARGVRRSWEI